MSSDGPLRLPSDPAGAELETATEAAIGRGEKNRSPLSRIDNSNLKSFVSFNFQYTRTYAYT